MQEEDFDLDSLATYLHLLPAQIQKLASRGKIPGRRIGGEWRFSPAEIHHWLEERIGISGDDELAEVEGVLGAQLREKDQWQVADLLPSEAIDLAITGRSSSSVIQAMADLAANTGLLWDPDKMATAVKARETLHPTALDCGVALLHPRRPLASILAQDVLALGRTVQGIPFGGAQGSLTDVFFLIASYDDRSHLRTLARISRLITATPWLDEIRDLDDPAEIVARLREHEADLG